MTLSAALLKHWVFGAFLCKFVNFTPTVTALVSTFTVAIIAVERWFFIVNKKKFDRRCTILTLILLWLGSILIASPEFISRQIQEVDSQPILKIRKNDSSFTSKNNNDTDILHNYYRIKPACNIEKNYYCVLKPDLRMRIFSYIVITVQYLVPFLFVSVSCYSISRFLKRRMQRMRSYQTQNRSSRQAPILLRKKSSHLTDETTEQELTSCDDLPTAINSNENKSNHLFYRFRQSFQKSKQSNGDRNSMNLIDEQRILRCQSHTEKRFHRSRKLLICVAALFTSSWLPLTIVQFYLEHNDDIFNTRDGANFAYGYLLIPCYLISSLSAWVNPIIYNYINRSFRREFYSLYSCCFKSSSEMSRREITSIGSKRHRLETVHIDRSNDTLSTRATIKQSTPFVSFADETTAMMHGQI
jgi:hypothetical protein